MTPTPENLAWGYMLIGWLVMVAPPRLICLLIGAGLILHGFNLLPH